MSNGHEAAHTLRTAVTLTTLLLFFSLPSGHIVTMTSASSRDRAEARIDDCPWSLTERLAYRSRVAKLDARVLAVATTATVDATTGDSILAAAAAAAACIRNHHAPSHR